jgi:hypothetical protein
MLDYATIVLAAATGFCVLTTAIIAAAIALCMMPARCAHLVAWLTPARALPRPIDAVTEDATPRMASERPLTASPCAPASPLPASRPEGYEADTGVSPGCEPTSKMLDYATIVFVAATGFCVLTTAIIAAATALYMIPACCMHIAAWLMHSIPTRALPRPIDAATEDASPRTASGRPLTATPRAPASPLPASRPEGYEADTGVSPGRSTPTSTHTSPPQPLGTRQLGRIRTLARASTRTVPSAPSRRSCVEPAMRALLPFNATIRQPYYAHFGFHLY